MIDEKRTKELFGYTSDSLTHKSGKKVIAVCDRCEKVRTVSYYAYRGLCHKCALRTDETRRKISEAHKGKTVSDETRRRMSDSRKGAKHHFYGKSLSDEHRQKLSEAHKDKSLSDEHRQNISEAKKNPSDETRRKIGEAQKGKEVSDETRKKLSEANKNPSDETRRKIGEAQKGKKVSDETRKKLSDSHKGEKSPNWRGGISFEPYCPKFNEAFKEYIREKFDRICFLCPKTEAENGQKLSVHHVNYDKLCLCNDVECEFVPLCVSCHAKTNFNQEYWENLIMDKLKDNS